MKITKFINKNGEVFWGDAEAFNVVYIRREDAPAMIRDGTSYWYIFMRKSVGDPERKDPRVPAVLDSDGPSRLGFRWVIPAVLDSES